MTAFQPINGGPNYLEAWRLHRGMSRDELASAVKPPTTGAVIWHLETGKRRLSLRWLRRLAEPLAITAGTLLDRHPRADIDALDRLTPARAQAAACPTPTESEAA